MRESGQLVGASGLSASSRPRARRGTIRARCLKLGANTPWKRVRFKRGLGTNAASRAIKSSGSNTTWVEPSLNGCLYWYTTRPRPVQSKQLGIYKDETSEVPAVSINLQMGPGETKEVINIDPALTPPSED